MDEDDDNHRDLYEQDYHLLVSGFTSTANQCFLCHSWMKMMIVVMVRMRTIKIYLGREAKAELWNLGPLVQGGAMVVLSETSSQ